MPPTGRFRRNLSPINSHHRHGCEDLDLIKILIYCSDVTQFCIHKMHAVMIKSSKSPKDIFFNMCKSHNFLMISNCDFLSSDIVLSKSASSGLSAQCGRSPGPASNEQLLSSPVSASHRPAPWPRSLSLNSLYSAGDGNVARSKSHWPPHKPEKARAELTAEPSRDDLRAIRPKTLIR